LPSKGCGAIFSNGFRLAGLLLAIAVPPWKSRDSARRQGISPAHKKTFDIHSVAMVVKTIGGRWTTLHRHADVKILFSDFFRKVSWAGMISEKSLIQNGLRRVRLPRRLPIPLLAVTII
jgi:hypothetical protein